MHLLPHDWLCSQRSLLVVVVAAVIFGLVQDAQAQSASSAKFYSQHVKPLLAEKCVSCHGPLEQSSGLRLDAGKLIHEFAEGTDLVVPDEVEASELLVRVSHADDDLRMPPPGDGTALNEHEIDLLRRWIKSGADYPQDETFLASPEKHWAFQPLMRPAIPKPRSDSQGQHKLASAEPANPIDAFLQHQRSERGVVAVGRAAPESLRRRLSFSLTGLPAQASPHSDLQSSTDSDSADVDQPDEPRAVRRAVDRMLASPEHAERWARHWMDVWRYSDWDGYKSELRGSQRHIWHWRDWIIQSLAADKPYDQMVLEMLAADEWDPLNPDALPATGFLARNYHRSNRNIWLDATVEHTSKAFLGLTIDCAKCHDHKYDPIAQEEFFQFRAIFEPHQTRTDRVAGQVDPKLAGIPRAYDSDLDAKTSFLIGGDEKRPDESRKIRPKAPRILGGSLQIKPVALPLLARAPHLRAGIRATLVAAEKEKLAQAQTEWEKKQDDPVAALALETARAKFAAFVARYDADQAKYSSQAESGDDGSSEAQSEGKRREAERLAMRAHELQNEHRLAAADLAVAQARAELEAAKPSDKKGPVSQDDAKAKQRQKQIDDAQRALSAAQTKRDQALQATQQPADDAAASYDPIAEVYPETSSGRRLALARWITSPENPLAARVAVNHIWMRHFGKPLVDHVFDFGLRTPEPLHRELLDWLAVELIEGGWRMKPLHRLIVTSEAFALASSGDAACEATNRSLDPDNETYWRFDPIRLEAEAIRDSLLAVADQLDHRLGGPDIDHTRGEEVLRRSLYFRHAYEKQMTMLTTFDAASPNECYRRDTSVIPQQALVLANSELARRMSETLAKQLHQESSESSKQDSGLANAANTADTRFVQAAFRRVLGRLPSEQEEAACRQFLQSQPLEVAGDAQSAKQAARASLVHVLINHNDFVTVR